MKTPAGKECKFFYGDYYRGRNREECRLLIDSGDPGSWKPGLCFNCPVPDILLANACTFMTLKAKTYRPFPFLRQQVQATAFCIKCNCPVTEPRIGCGQCHPLPSIFAGDLDEPDPSG
jgi:hypothetical protein